MATKRVNLQLSKEADRHCVEAISYRGYKSVYCGAGKVIFTDNDGDEVKAHSRKRINWLDDAWSAAKSEIDRRRSFDCLRIEEGAGQSGEGPVSGAAR